MRIKKFSKLILIVLVGVSLYSFIGETMESERPPLLGVNTYEKVELNL